jgi:galactose mutarotase-like enzyme
VNQEVFDCLVMKTDTLTVEVLPELGGKISSLRRKWVELLQAPLQPYMRRTSTMAFAESDASGWDECLPSVSACELAGPSGQIQVPDHGEFWRLPCSVERIGSGEVRLSATGVVLPLHFERTLRLEDKTLRMEYRLENVSKLDVPYMWSAHPLFCVDAGDVIVLPSSVHRVSVEGSAYERLGAKGSVHHWPVATLRGGEKIDLRCAGDVSDNTGDKLYAAAPREGWAAIERRQAGVRLQVEFDPDLLPWLGMWLCYGGWPEGYTSRQQCVAIEPCTAPADSLAETLDKGFARVLTPGQTSCWWMAITVSEIW